jgi:hypothetical protein
MKKFHFSKKYFKETIFDDPATNIRVVVEETPSMDIEAEDYSLRVETRHLKLEKPIHRTYAIEQHKHQIKHNFPHLQFTFHTEAIGTFHLRLDFESVDEYHNSILGFIYKIKGVLENLEPIKEGITEEILIIDLVENLSDKGKFLEQKISESINKYGLEFKRGVETNKIDSNPLLIEFLGMKNIEDIKKKYSRVAEKNR